MASEDELTLVGKARLSFAKNWKPYWEAIKKHAYTVQSHHSHRSIEKLQKQINFQLGTKIMGDIKKDYEKASQEDKDKVEQFIKERQAAATQFYNEMLAKKNIDPVVLKKSGGMIHGRKRFIR